MIQRAPEGAEAFLLAEYENLWRECARSQHTQETMVRYFLLIIGAIAAVGALLSGLGPGDKSKVSLAAIEAFGCASVLLAGTGFLTGLYVAHEQGARVKYLYHINSIRGYFKGWGGLVRQHLTLPGTGGPPFVPPFWYGRSASILIVALLSSAALVAGAYLLGNAGDVALAVGGSTSLPWRNWTAILAFALGPATLAAQWLVFQNIARAWQRKYERDVAGGIQSD
jgi:hypothetical protein